MATEFKPVKLSRNGQIRFAYSATEETDLRYNGWHSPRQVQPGSKAPAEEAPAPKPAPKNS